MPKKDITRNMLTIATHRLSGVGHYVFKEDVRKDGPIMSLKRMCVRTGQYFLRTRTHYVRALNLKEPLRCSA